MGRPRPRPRPVPARRRPRRVRRRLDAAGRRSAPPSPCSPPTRSPSTPAPAARRSCPAPCCSCSSPRSAPTGTASCSPWPSSPPASSPRRCCGCASPSRHAPSLGRRPPPAVDRRCRPPSLGGTVVVLGAWIIGPRLPGADADPLVDTHNDAGGVTEVAQPARRHPHPARQPRRHRAVRRPADARRRTGGSAGSPSSTATRGACPTARSTTSTASSSDAAPGLDREPPGDHDRRRCAASSCRARPSRCGPTGDGLRWNAETSTLVRVDRDLEPGDQLHDRVGDAELHAPTCCGRRRPTDPPDPIYLELPADFPQSVSDTAVTVTAGAADDVRPDDRPAELVPHRVPVQPRRAPGPQQQRHRGVPAPAHRLLRAVRRHVRGDGPLARHPGPRRRRLHAGLAAGRRQPASVLGKNAHAWPEVWFDGLGWVAVRADARPRRARRRGLHRRAPPAQDESAPQAPAPATGAAPATAGARRHGADPARGRCRCPTRTRQVDEGARRRAASRTTVPDRRADWVRRRPSCSADRSASLLLRRPSCAGGAAAHPPADVARQMTTLWRRALGAVEATGCRVDPVADAARAGPGGRPAPARGGPPAEVAGRGGHGGDVRHRTTRSPHLGRRPDRRRAGPAAVVPAGRAHRHRLDDDRRPAAALLHGLGLSAPDGAVRTPGFSRRSRGCRRGDRRRATR